MTVDAQGRMHEPKGIPTGGRYAAGSTGHGVVDDLPGMPDVEGRVGIECEEWLNQPHEDDARQYWREGVGVCDGARMREDFADEVTEWPGNHFDDPTGIDQEKLDGRYSDWLAEHKHRGDVTPLDPVEEHRPWPVRNEKARALADHAWRRLEDGLYDPYTSVDDQRFRQRLGEDHDVSAAFANKCAEALHITRLSGNALDLAMARARTVREHGGDPAKAMRSMFAAYARTWNGPSVA